MEIPASHSDLVEVSGQLTGLISILISDSWGLCLGHQAWKQESFLLNYRTEFGDKIRYKVLKKMLTLADRPKVLGLTLVMFFNC